MLGKRVALWHFLKIAMSLDQRERESLSTIFLSSDILWFDYQINGWFRGCEAFKKTFSRTEQTVF